jgi:hypothetical protein
MKNNLTSYIKKNNKKSENQNLSFFGSINVFVKDPLPEDISLRIILRRIENLIPHYLVNNIDAVYVGQFDEFVEMETNAAYKDGALYITNDQYDEDDMIDDIVHEIAHAVEELAYEEIYADDKVEIEFLGKRKRLQSILRSENFNVQRYDFLNPQYSKEFDIFLYREVGYPLLTTLTMGLFPSPYAATSLREYFARGFEEYYLKDRNYLTKISPMLYNKVHYLDNLK